MIEIPEHYHIILASRSQRRQQLLGELGIKFEVVIKEYIEKYPRKLIGKEIAEYLAGEKADCFKGEISENEIVITADTIVWCKNKILGKPANYKEAADILNIISGNTHEVITGVCIISANNKMIFSESTKVKFDLLSQEEINYYIQKYEPYDKAGAYGIQEWIGLVGISSIEGSYFNVMGLPIQRLYRELKEFITNNKPVK